MNLVKLVNLVTSLDPMQILTPVTLMKQENPVELVDILVLVMIVIFVAGSLLVHCDIIQRNQRAIFYLNLSAPNLTKSAC